jgi:hypothetical protein
MRGGDLLDAKQKEAAAEKRQLQLEIERQKAEHHRLLAEKQRQEEQIIN